MTVIRVSLRTDPFLLQKEFRLKLLFFTKIYLTPDSDSGNLHFVRGTHGPDDKRQ
jgi:hypothetical protein